MSQSIFNLGHGHIKKTLTINTADFYTKIDESGSLPKTSQPAVGDFVETFRRLGQNGDEIISIHLTSKLSGTYQSAKLAASLVAETVQVTVIDSLAGSAGLGWLVYEAANLIRQGFSTIDIVRILENKRTQISIFFAIDTLEFAQLSGRVGKLGSVVGTLLNIKPIIGLNNGLIDVVDKVRSKKAATARILDLTQDKIEDRPIYLAVVHAQAEDRAEHLLSLASERFNIEMSYIKDVAISLAVHFGPGTVGLIGYPIGPD